MCSTRFLLGFVQAEMLGPGDTLCLGLAFTLRKLDQWEGLKRGKLPRLTVLSKILRIFLKNSLLHYFAARTACTSKGQVHHVTETGRCNI